MICEHFGKCGSCTLYDLNYEEQKKFKINNSKILFKPLHIEDFTFFDSKQSHYRTRAEFSIWHDDEKISYAMHGINKKEIVKIENCPKVCENIYNLMPKLLQFISKNQTLKFKLFSVEFLSTKDEVLVILIYHKKIDESFDKTAHELEKALNIKVIGRSRGVKRVVSDDFINEVLHVENLQAKSMKYKIYDTGFVQPNSYVNGKMIDFIISEVAKQKRDDLLELYCGHGNFTMPLSYMFDKVLATEISKTSIKSANENVILNDIKNITFARLSAEEFTEAWSEVREFERLKEIDLKKYNFSHILVDPPRAGLDSISINLVKRFKNIIYISCSQESLKRDLDELVQTHKIIKFVLFDQFPYTKHIESGVVFELK
ncbi:MAG: tRNA (uridine(54)-C5)-methyltransferase TrmA [Campylobacteraceae bacterium]|nr:tRNA (uridine(54)-C5)-methyltransferase TrmA [Campylobacteraceae bacterium]